MFKRKWFLFSFFSHFIMCVCVCDFFFNFSYVHILFDWFCYYLMLLTWVFHCFEFFFLVFAKHVVNCLVLSIWSCSWHLYVSTSDDIQTNGNKMQNWQVGVQNKNIRTDATWIPKTNNCVQIPVMQFYLNLWLFPLQ